MRSGFAVLAVAAGIAGVLAGEGLADTHETRLVSRASGAGGDPADADATDPALSGNAQAVAFVSAATNLGGPSPEPGIWVRDLVKDNVKLVSRKGGGNIGPVVSGVTPAISKDGRRIAFESGGDVLVRDLDDKTTTKANKGSGQCGTNGYDPDISADGTSVAWQTASPGAIYTNPGNHVCFVDLTAKNPKPAIADRATGNGGAVSDGSAFRPTLSADGSRIAFEAYGSNLPGANALAQVYVREPAKKKTILVSRADGGGAAGTCATSGLCDSDFAAISDDGERVAFRSFAENLDPAAVHSVAGIQFPSVYVRDLKSDQTQLVSRDDGAEGAGGDFDSDSAAISGDGRYVAFRSRALNLREPSDVSEAGAAGFQVFVRDLKTQTTIGVSRANGPNGALGSGESGTPSLAAKAPVVAFGSESFFDGVGGSGPTGASLQEIWVREFGAAD